MDNQKKYLDADYLLAGIYSDNPKDVMLYIANFPAADVVEALRVRQVLLAEFCKEEEAAVDALMERMK